MVSLLYIICNNIVHFDVEYLLTNKKKIKINTNMKYRNIFIIIRNKSHCKSVIHHGNTYCDGYNQKWRRVVWLCERAEQTPLQEDMDRIQGSMFNYSYILMFVCQEHTGVPHELDDRPPSEDEVMDFIHYLREKKGNFLGILGFQGIC